MSRTVRPALVPNAQKFHLDGKDYTIGSILTEAKSRGVNIHHATIYARLRQGMTTMDDVLNPPLLVRQRASKQARDREKAEMAAFLATIPKKRYF